MFFGFSPKLLIYGVFVFDIALKTHIIVQGEVLKMSEFGFSEGNQWELDDLLLSEVDKEQPIEEVDQEQSNDRVDLREQTIPWSSQYTTGIVDTSKLRVDFEKVDSKRVHEVNLHRQVILGLDNLLVSGGRYYSAQELGQEQVTEEPVVESVRIEDSIILNSSGETLGERLRKNHYISSRNRLKSQLEELYKSMPEKIYEKHQEKNIRLDVLKKEAKVERRVLSHDNDSFIQKHRRKTVYEKSILKKLGVSLKDLELLISPKSILTREEKGKLLTIANTIKGRKKVGGHKGQMVNDSEMNILYFLDLCRYASMRNVYYADGMHSLTSVNYKLKKLEKMGLVRCVIVYGTPGVYSLTNLGRKFIGSTHSLPNRGQVNPSNLSERIYVNHVLACLYSGCLDILQEGVKQNRVNFLGEKVQGEEIIPEFYLTRSLYKKSGELRGGTFTRANYPGEVNFILREAWEIAWRDWENKGRLVESAPELACGNDEVVDNYWLYVLFYEIGLKNSYVLPDIVVKRPRNADGSPNSIAIEVERQIKSVDEYVTKLNAYKQDNRVYSKVVYVTPHNLVAQRIKEAAERIHFDRFDVVPMLSDKGLVGSSTSHWVI